MELAPWELGRVPGVSVPPPGVIHVDPAVQMSHVPASSCSGFALKGWNGSEAVRHREACVGVCEHIINFSFLL